MFAEVETVKIQSLALLKLTPNEVDQINNAYKHGLGSEYRDNRYVFYVSENGTPLNWFGFNGKANEGLKEPYVVCPVHTKKAWEDYEASQATEPPTEPPTEAPEEKPEEKPTEKPTEPEKKPEEKPTEAPSGN